MKKKLVLMGVAYILSTLVLTIIAVNIFKSGVEGISSEQDKYKKHIGNTVVLQKDSLKVVDYSFINGTFTLSNGVKVDTSLVFKQK